MRKGRIEINKELCKACEFCIEFCPKKIIKKGERQNQSGFFPAEYCDPKGECTACSLCGIVCPEAAIEVFKADCRNDCENCDCRKEDKDG